MVEQKDMGWMLVSNPDVMSISGIMYPYIPSKDF